MRSPRKPRAGANRRLRRKRAGKKCEERGANAPRDPFTRYGVYNRIDHRSQTEQRHRKTDDEAGVRSVHGNSGANHYPRIEGASFV